MAVWREERGGTVRRRAFGAFCRVCHAWFPARISQRRRGFDFCCSKRCANILIAPLSPTYQAIVNRKASDSSYVSIRSAPHREHRAVMERLLGRPLLTEEHVHHINGDKADNDPANLVVLTKSTHSRLHMALSLKSGGR